nr:leucine-rich repeat extensin-like protein 6 [Quercus suber]
MKTNPLLTLAFWGIFSLIFLSKPSHQASNFPPPQPPLPNPRLLKAYTALQAWKHSITSDPKNSTLNWCGPNVCNYTGVTCAPAPDDPHVITVAGIDLNHADIAGTLPEELGLLTDLAFFHINSNRFYGTIPDCFRYLHLLHELDISNNQFSGPFPSVVLYIPSLIFLDIRFN